MILGGAVTSQPRSQSLRLFEFPVLSEGVWWATPGPRNVPDHCVRVAVGSQVKIHGAGAQIRVTTKPVCEVPVAGK
jgi:hypothetical protein